MFELQPDDNSETFSPNFVKETDETNFEQDVLTASMALPVIVNFYSIQSPLCSQVSAGLEKAVVAAQGKALLVKVNIDRNMALSQAMRLETVPTVYVFFQAKPVDGFAGGKSEAELKVFVEKLVKLYGGEAAENSAAAINAEEIKKLVTEADDFFQDKNYDEAMANYSIVLEADENNMDALGGIGWCLLSQGDFESVREMLANLSGLQLKNSRLQGLKFMLSMEEKVKELDSEDALFSKKGLQAKFDLAVHYLAKGSFEQAVDALIEIIAKDREWEDKKARKFLLEVFGALGDFHPLTSLGRRKLSAVLFS